MWGRGWKKSIISWWQQTCLNSWRISDSPEKKQMSIFVERNLFFEAHADLKLWVNLHATFSFVYSYKVNYVNIQLVKSDNFNALMRSISQYICEVMHVKEAEYITNIQSYTIMICLYLSKWFCWFGKHNRDEMLRHLISVLHIDIKFMLNLIYVSSLYVCLVVPLPGLIEWYFLVSVAWQRLLEIGCQQFKWSMQDEKL